jgi:hypothetical protein
VANWTGFVIFIGYLVVMRIVGRTYFRRRHGVTFGTTEPGALTAAAAGLLWPVAVFVPAVRRPGPCAHHRHVLVHARLVEEARLADELRHNRH